MNKCRTALSITRATTGKPNDKEKSFSDAPIHGNDVPSCIKGTVQVSYAV